MRWFGFDSGKSPHPLFFKDGYCLVSVRNVLFCKRGITEDSASAVIRVADRITTQKVSAVAAVQSA